MAGAPKDYFAKQGGFVDSVEFASQFFKNIPVNRTITDTEYYVFDPISSIHGSHNIGKTNIQNKSNILLHKLR